MLCILAVFIPAFFMEGAARSLFVPLALAVGFAMVASYLLSSTLVPVLASGCCGGTTTATAHRRDASAFDRLRDRYARACRAAWSGCAGSSCWFTWSSRRRHRLVRRPAARAGDFPDRRRRPVRAAAPRAGRHAGRERPSRSRSKTLDVDRQRSRARTTSRSRIGFVGVQHAAYPVNTIHLWTSGPEEGGARRCSSSRGAVRIEELQGTAPRACCPRNFPACGSASSRATSSAG